MNCYILDYDVERFENRGVMAYNNNYNEIDIHCVRRGVFIKEWDDSITFYVDLSEGIVVNDYLDNNLSWLIVSDNFKKVIEDAGIDGIQYLPINIMSKGGNEKLGNYYVANIYNLLNAVDMNESEYIQFRSGGYSIVKYAVKADNIKNCDIFRLKEGIVPIFVSEKMKKLIQYNKLTGFAFTKVKVV
ncbi:MAG: hypothetical protein Q8936_23175 [Bacillota bacterium]|nr:hypothetical protein [Bacillota bacterium]